MVSLFPNNLNFDTLKQSQHFETRLGRFSQQQSSQGFQPHWQDFMNALTMIGSDELENRRLENQRLLSENGVTYTVYNEQGHANQSWPLDPIPLLINNKEWQLIEKGLMQRAHLLSLILRDIYGEQNIIRNNIVPAELIFSHQGFLLPCIGSFQQAINLPLYAANLVHGSDGTVRVLNDHTQAPSGMGYSLENRHISSQVMEDLFKEFHAQSLSSFFTEMQNTLARLAPGNKTDPHMVMLTPGALNETYFEHAYLAAHLGFTLAQGDDLTVRENKVWLRTLEGLRGIDVLLRRIDDNYCDPLELLGHSQLGVAGLLQSIRLGNVGMANPLGSSVLENQGLLAFLPALCRYFLDEDLLLPSVASWWCGQKKECDFVIENMENLVIKSTNRGRQNTVLFGHQISQSETQALIQKIRARPYLFVGQEPITFSTVPTLIDGKIENRNSILRSFAIARTDDYKVMPGGLTRVAASKDQFTVSNQFGALNKDTWVLEDKETDTFITEISTVNHNIHAISEPLTSRAADNLFWVGRNYERIRNSARLLRSILIIQSNQNNTYQQSGSACVQQLLAALTHISGTYPGFVKLCKADAEFQEREIASLFSETTRHGTIAYSILAFYQAAFNIRDLWSLDTWHSIDSIKQYWLGNVLSQPPTKLQMPSFLMQLSTRLAAFSGLASESMTRESGWLLLQIGRKLESSLAIIALLRATVVLKHDDILQHKLLESILHVTDSFSLYQRRYRSAKRLPMVLELLLMDEKHPDALLFQLSVLKDNLASLPGDVTRNRLRKEDALILKAYTTLKLATCEQLLLETESGIYDNLDQLLSELGEYLSAISESITLSYFNHIRVRQQL